jgi:HD-like signal output (HDOD) protein
VQPPSAPDSADAGQYQRIGELLIEEGLITEAQLEKVLAIQKKEGGKTFELLVREKFLDKESLHAFLSKKSGVPAIELKRFRIERELVLLIPRELAQEHYVLPIDKLGKLLTVAMACPIDKRTIAEIEQLTGLRVQPMLCKLDEIHDAVQKYYPDESGGFGLGLIPSALAGRREDVGDKVAELAALPAPDALLARLQELGASGLHDAARLASTDAPMAAMLISLANSAAYGMNGRVDSVPMAVALVGWPGVQVACAACREAREVKEAAPWRERGLRCARIAGALAAALGESTPAAVYTAGLLHELGRFALATVSPQKYRLIDAAMHGDALVEEEEKWFSLTHAEAGARLAVQWHLPSTLGESLRHYLRPEAASSSAASMTRIVSVAARLAVSDGEFSPEHLAACEDTLQAMGMDAQRAASIGEAALNR